MQRRIPKLGAWARTWARARIVIHDSLIKFYDENSLMVAASMAYYSLLSVCPLMLLLFGLSGVFLHRFEFSGQLAMVLERYLPMKPDFIMRNLVGISRAYGRLGLVSFLLLLWSSSGVFLPLERALNRAWEVERGRSWLKSRLLALEMALVLGVLILISSGLTGLNMHIHTLMSRWFSHDVKDLVDLVYHGLIMVTTFMMTLSMFLILFQRLPNRPMRLRQVLPSAVFTGLFWEAARSLFTLFLPLFNYRHVYGSIGVVVALMTWAYISSGVVLFGAQVSHALYGTLKAHDPGEFASAPPGVLSPADVL